MMRCVVVDASVVAKWFVDEVHSEKAIELRDAYIDNKIEIAAPEIMPYEVLDALKNTGLFKENELVMVARALSFYGFKLYTLAGDLSERTVEVAVEKNVTIYEASYIALAEKLNAKLYTSDKELVEKVGLDFVFHISDWL